MSKSNKTIRGKFAYKKNGELTNLGASYLAGIIDGEGCIRIDRSFRKNGSISHFDIAVIVVNTNKRLLDVIQDLFPAELRERTGKRPNNWKNVYYWRVRCDKAVKLLKMIYPYLVGKKEQAKIVLEFMKKRKKNCKKYQGRLDEKELEWRNMMCEKIRKLNHRGK